MKNIINWVFRSDLNLKRYWWHRLITTSFLMFFFLVFISTYLLSISISNFGVAYARPHNVTVHSSLYEFTESSFTDGSSNSIPVFFENNKSVGIFVNNKMHSLLVQDFYKSYCSKNIESSIDEISKRLASLYSAETGITLSSAEYGEFKNAVSERIRNNPDRSCFIERIAGLDIDSLQLAGPISKQIVSYSPNILFYLDVSLLLISAFAILFFLFVLLYYRLIIYVIFGPKRQ